MRIIKIPVGPLQTNCYIVSDGNSSLVIDPGDEPDIILDEIKKNSLNVDYIIITHAHFDHIGAVPEIKEETSAKIALHPDELMLYESAPEQATLWGFELPKMPPPDIFIEDGSKIEIGSTILRVMHTPGHSPGGISLYGDGFVFTGDTLFAGSVGRTDFFGGSIEKLKESFRRLLSLPPETTIYPGHGETSKVGIERKENLFSENFL